VSKTLTLYTRAGCPLCEEMASEVRAQLAGSGHGLSPVDVDADPALKAQYGWDVPLLFDGASEICRHELNLSAFQEWLRGHS
jgi:peroxiredoxin